MGFWVYTLVSVTVCRFPQEQTTSGDGALPVVANPTTSSTRTRKPRIETWQNSITSSGVGKLRKSTHWVYDPEGPPP